VSIKGGHCDLHFGSFWSLKGFFQHTVLHSPAALSLPPSWLQLIGNRFGQTRKLGLFVTMRFRCGEVRQSHLANQRGVVEREVQLAIDSHAERIEVGRTNGGPVVACSGDQPNCTLLVAHLKGRGKIATLLSRADKSHQ